MNFNNITKFFTLLFIATLITSCSVFKSANKNILGNGLYTKKTKNEKQNVYLQTEDERLKIYEVNEFRTVDTTNFEVVEFRKPLTSPFEKFTLIEQSLDLDILTIPLK